MCSHPVLQGIPQFPKRGSKARALFPRQDLGASSYEQDDGADVGYGRRVQRDRDTEGAAGFYSLHAELLRISVNAREGKACPQLTSRLPPQQHFTHLACFKLS